LTTHHDNRLAGVLAAALTLTGCVGPMGPAPQLVPPPSSPSAVSADMRCRQYADAQIAPMRDQVNSQGVGNALLGAGLGAALGAAVGGGRGAGIGAASGAIVGTGVGAANAQDASAYLQQQYNAYYAQCMASRSSPAQPYAAPGPGYGPAPGYAPQPSYPPPASYPPR